MGSIPSWNTYSDEVNFFLDIVYVYSYKCIHMFNLVREILLFGDSDPSIR
jgi:hypothetical protein